MTQPDWFSHGWPHIWLPYTQMQTALPPLPVVSAQGCEIELADGRTLIDGTAAWWSMCHGYQHPQIIEAIQKQAAQLSHVMFAGLAHEPAYTLAKQLIDITPASLSRVFFADSGSIAVEVALKMALQYWLNKGNHKKKKLICFEHAYHGDTFGAMSVSGRGGFHSAYDSLTAKNYVLAIPSDEYGMAELEQTISEIAPNVAALIIEPLVQGAGGMRFYSADILAEIRRIARENNILFIADEIMSGFYRTGSRFACDEAGIEPDIMCIGKALTGGHINLGATLASEDIFDAFLGDEQTKALMHGPTFMANPLACAAASASISLFSAGDYEARTEAIESQLQEGLRPLKHINGVRDVRVRGAIGVVQLDTTPQDIATLRAACPEHGVWLRPFNDIIYIMPPLVITSEQLHRLIDATTTIITQWSQHRKHCTQ